MRILRFERVDLIDQFFHWIDDPSNLTFPREVCRRKIHACFSIVVGRPGHSQVWNKARFQHAPVECCALSKPRLAVVVVLVYRGRVSPLCHPCLINRLSLFSISMRIFNFSRFTIVSELRFDSFDVFLYYWIARKMFAIEIRTKEGSNSDALLFVITRVK